MGWVGFWYGVGFERKWKVFPSQGVVNFALATNNFANFYELAMGLVNYVPCAVPDVTDSRREMQKMSVVSYFS